MKNDKIVSYRELLRFFLPLAVLPVMISLTHTIINSALARLPLPELSLAIFTVVKSVTNIINAPTLMSRQLIVSLVKDVRSFYLSRRFLWLMTAGLFLILLLTAITPVGPWIFRTFFGFEAEREILLATRGLLITSFLPLVVLWRNMNQALVTVLKRTEISVPGIMVRLMTISLFLWWVVKTNIMTGIYAGGLAWIVGIALEGIIIITFLHYKFDFPGEVIELLPGGGNSELTVKEIINFFLPLGFMISLTMFIQPVIQSGIARRQDSVKSLAAYGVAWGLVLLIIGPLKMLNQLVMVYIERIGGPNWQPVKRFGLISGILMVLMIIIVGLTPAGGFLLRQIMGLSPEVSGLARQTVLAFVLVPLIRVVRELYWGILMDRQVTTIIGAGKVVNLILVGVILFAVPDLFALPASVTGALVYSAGEGVETFIIWRYTVRRLGAKNGERTARTGLF